MKKVLLIVFSISLTLSMINCSSNDRDDETKNYVGKWYFKKASVYIDGDLDGTNDFTGTCEGKSYFDIKSDGNVDYANYSNQYVVTTNNYECQLKNHSGSYNDNTKKLKLIQGNDVTESNVEFVGSEMQLTYETTQIFNNATIKVKSVLILNK